MNNSQAQLTFNLSVMFSAELQETKVGDQGPSGVFMPPHLTLLRQLRCARPFQVLCLITFIRSGTGESLLPLLLHVGKPQLGEPLPQRATVTRRSALDDRIQKVYAQMNICTSS